MWTRFTITVAYAALLVAYGSALLIGWSLTQTIPGISASENPGVLARSVALAVVAWPVWFLHWRWARRDWFWESKSAQYFLAFFTAIGLIGTVVIGTQLITRLFEVMLGARPPNEDSTGFLFGALWSTVISLWMWIYHGRTWLEHRRRVGGRSSGSDATWRVNK
ncbi:MAG: DUF5671 domain-containing protein [Chloroflexi bacterium]|nr:DUF5671 domain-containing protein [Chloroflexota bacterium]